MRPPDKRPVNMVFQNYALFPHLNVGDNIAFGLRRRKVADRETTQRVDEALQLVKLAGYQKRKPHELIGGQQQRVALARALVNRPVVLLLDEPLGALDLKLRRSLQDELKRIQTEVGITFVYVTHDQEEALAMSDRIAVMHAGKVEQLGSPEELYERPATRFVADFIGTTNLLQGTVEGVDGDGRLVALGGGARRAAARRAPRGAGRRAQRPPRDHRCAPCQRPIRRAPSRGGRVEQVAYLGGTVRYMSERPGDSSVSAVAPKTGIACRSAVRGLAWPAHESARARRVRPIAGRRSRP